MEPNQNPPADADGGGPPAGTIAKLLMAGVVGVLFVVFALQNSGSIELKFLVWDFTLRRNLLMLLSAVMGIAVWELVSFVWRRRRAG